jgi:hypothetical protein
MTGLVTQRDKGLVFLREIFGPRRGPSVLLGQMAYRE